MAQYEEKRARLAERKLTVRDLSRLAWLHEQCAFYEWSWSLAYDDDRARWTLEVGPTPTRLEQELSPALAVLHWKEAVERVCAKVGYVWFQWTRALPMSEDTP